MTHLPLDTVQTAILYDDLDKMAEPDAFFSFVIARLNAELGERAGLFTAINAPDGAAFGLIGNPQNNLHITVEIMRTPMQMAGFQTILNSGYYQTENRALLETIKSHKSAVLTGVGLGTTPFPLDHPVIAELGMAEELGGDQDQDKFELRLLILQTVTSIICRMSTPAAVHWSQSHQIFAPETFLKHADSGFCLPLYIGWGAFGDDDAIGSHKEIGVRGYGSQHLTGHLVQFAPSAQPMQSSYQSVVAFVAYCREIGRMLSDGETYQEPNGDVIAVEHFTTPDIPFPQIRLRLHSKGFAQAVETPRARRKPPGQPKAASEAPASGFVDLRGAMKGRAPTPAPLAKAAAQREPSTPAPVRSPAPGYNAAGQDRLRQAMMRANASTTPHSLKTAMAQTATEKVASEPLRPANQTAPSDMAHDIPPGESPTDWIKDHVHDHRSHSSAMPGRLIKIAIAGLCLYVIVQIVAPMSNIMAITTMN